MQLVDPEDIPAMEHLTQELLLLREKVASVESQGQEVSGNRRQQVSSWDTGSSVASPPCLTVSVPDSSESLSVCPSAPLPSLQPGTYFQQLSAGHAFAACLQRSLWLMLSLGGPWLS